MKPAGRESVDREDLGEVFWSKVISERAELYDWNEPSPAVISDVNLRSASRNVDTTV